VISAAEQKYRWRDLELLWQAAQTQRYRHVLEILEIDFSRAFDTIHLDKLMEVLKTFLDETELVWFNSILTDTSLEARVEGAKVILFNTSVDVPPYTAWRQGDGLSLVPFIVYI